MFAPYFKIGDKVKRIDYDDKKIYTIDKVRTHEGIGWIYGMEGQTWADGWCWVAECNIKQCDVNEI